MSKKITFALTALTALTATPGLAQDDMPRELHLRAHASRLYNITLVASLGDNPLADHVRAANDRFTDVAAAVAEGYGPIPCASGIQGGAMGVHFVNGDYLKDGVIDIAKPEAVMYEPMADGTMQLVAVEYIAFEGPAALEGHLFNFNPAPNRYGLDPFYELHVWAWKPNPTGTFADMNPDVTCEHAHASAG